MDEVYINKAEELEYHQESKSVIISDWIEDNKDLSSLKKVERLILRCKQHQNLNELITLKELTLFYINKSNLEITGLVNLNSLSLIKGNITNLNFLNNFNELKEFDANYLYKLNDISGLKFVSDTLEKLEFEACKNINWDDNEFNFRKLKCLKLIGCTLKNIDFIHEIPKLEILVITNSNIVSGDISPAKNIKFVSVDNKKHYNYWYDSKIRRIYKKKD